MDTLGQVCRELRISRKTLKKWLDRLKIEPTKHPRDWRHFTLTSEQVEAIRAARAEMPGSTSTRPPPLRTIGGLPDGLTSWRSFAKAHGVPEMTVQNAIASDRLAVVRGRWKVGRVYVESALDEQGRSRFHELWGRRPGFIRCVHCPHAMPYSQSLRA